MTELDYDTALAYLERAVDEKGYDYEYEIDGVTVTEYNEKHTETMSCSYFHHGAPSCIVGHVLSYMGYDGVAREGTGAGYLMRELGIDLDEGAYTLLNQVQDYQDGGMPWGEALDKARSLVQP